MSARSRRPRGCSRTEENDALGASADAAARLYLARRDSHLPSSKLDLRALDGLDEDNVENEREPPLDEAGSVPDDDCIARTVATVWQHVLLVQTGRARPPDFSTRRHSLQRSLLPWELERALDWSCHRL